MFPSWEQVRTVRLMHVITRKRLRDFGRRHPDAVTPLAVWFAILRRKRYRSPHELRRDFPAADVLGGSRTVFNIGGNKYRLVADVRYDLGRVYIRGVYTHAEYDRRSRSERL